MAFFSIRRGLSPCRSSAGLLLYFFLIAAAWAALSYADFLHELAKKESSLIPGKVNPYGYTGLFQMGEAAMIDAGYYKPDGTTKNDWKGTFTGKNGINSIADFKNNPNAQIQAIADYEKKQWLVIQSLGLSKYIGQSINGVPITQSGLVAGAHLVGYGGLKKYLTSNGAIDPVDGNKTPVSQYIQKFGGYTIGGAVPDYAAVQSASGGFGLPGSAAPVSTGTGPVSIGGSSGSSMFGLPAAPDPMGATPGEAFFNNTGYQYSSVSDPIKLITAAMLFLWASWTILATWKTYHGGGMTMAQLKTSVLRALIVLMAGLALIN